MDKRILSVLLVLGLATLINSANIIVLNPGCRQFDSSGNCVACSNRFYKNKEGICQPVNNNCRTFDPSNGACTSCYDGFSVVENVCLPKADDNTGMINCNELGENGTCKKCSNGYYFDAKHVCQLIPDTCSDFNMKTGKCQGCYQGYALDKNFSCVLSTTQNLDEPGCNKFQNGKCSKCSVGFYFDANKKCLPIPNTCQSFDAIKGKCQSCYPGYTLDSSNNCIVSVAEKIDQGCAKFEKGNCTKCSVGFYFNKMGKCIAIPPTCSNYNTSTQKCLGCYPGYALDQTGSCIVSVNDITDQGCTKFENNVCVKCSFGYYFDKAKNCKPIPTSCANFDTNKQTCQSCYPGYSLDSGKCVVSEAATGDPGCNTFKDGKCIKCSVGYYFDKFNNCKQVPANCANYDTKNEMCLSCYPGFSLDGGKCVVSEAVQGDQGCNTFKDGKCTKCSFGYYFDSKKNCKQIPPTCGNYDTTKQVCLNCYPGFVLDKGNCVVNNATQVKDAGCNSFQNGKCVKCSYGYYFDKQKNCKQAPPTCRDFNTEKQVCNSCYPGYSLDKSNVCVEETYNNTDFGCAKFENKKCVKCSFGYYFNKVSVCKAIPTTCSIFDSDKQQCMACYPGYSLNKNKECMQTPPVVGDQGCNKFEQGKCMSCSNGYYFNGKGTCTQIPPTCSDFNVITQQCRGCYPGYSLNAKKECVLSEVANIDPNCKQFRNDKCVQCSFGAYFDATGKCIVTDSLCKKFNSKSQVCEECYPGFVIDSSKKCVEAPMDGGDLNCKSIKNGQCVECSFRFYKDNQGKCVSVDPTCKDYNLVTGQCLGCYQGYKLNGKRCQKQELGNLTDTNCAEFKNGKCIKCSFGSFFNRNGLCQSVDPLCQTWSEVTGDCQSCYPSFEINSGKCVPSKVDNLDQNCAKFTNNKCVQCSRGFYFNSNKVCTQIDPLCSTFDSKSSQCFSCYTGYKIQSGKCVVDSQEISDKNCAQFSNSKCVKCSVGYYFNKDKCQAINPQCKFFDEKNKKCGDCYPGYVLSAGECIVGTKDNLCAESKDGICLKCVSRAYFNDLGLCSSVSQYCNQYNPFDGTCQTCYGGFQLVKGQCKSRVQSNGCIEYSKDNKKCLNCEKRRYLSNGQCLKIDEYCLQFNFFKNQCSACYSGYQVVDKKCIVSQIKAQVEIDNCFTYSMNGKCVQCFDRYYLQDNTCKEVNVFCKKYNFNTGDCTDCYTGFKLNGVLCVRK